MVADLFHAIGSKLFYNQRFTLILGLLGIIFNIKWATEGVS